jgi:hypothetical protein
MPTIPLYTQPAHADDPHDVRAPGGYEWWYFDAEDERHGRRLVAVVFDGFAFHPRYVRAYARYRRHPTRVAPPLPERFPCVSLAFYDRGELCQQALALARARPDGLIARRDGAVNLNVHCGPVDAALSFAPRHRHAPLELPLGSATHRWVLASPSCDVQGSIRCEGRTVAFTGRGYREHQYGTQPFALDVARWFRGRALFDDAAFAFQLARAPAATTDHVHLVEETADGLTHVPVRRAPCAWSRTARARVACPQKVMLDDVVQLHNPRVIDASAFHARLVYDAVCRGARCGEALCDAVHPARLLAPIVGRMIEKAIDRLAAQTA